MLPGMGMEWRADAWLYIEHAHGEVRCAIVGCDHLADLHPFSHAWIASWGYFLIGFDDHERCESVSVAMLACRESSINRPREWKNAAISVSGGVLARGKGWPGNWAQGCYFNDVSVACYKSFSSIQAGRYGQKRMRARGRFQKGNIRRETIHWPQRNVSSMRRPALK